MSEAVKRADKVSALEALALYEAGGRLTCPACAAALKTIPENLPPGTRPAGLVCPNETRHFLIYGESGEAMKAVREGMRRIAAETDKKKSEKKSEKKSD